MSLHGGGYGIAHDIVALLVIVTTPLSSLLADFCCWDVVFDDAGFFRLVDLWNGNVRKERHK